MSEALKGFGHYANQSRSVQLSSRWVLPDWGGIVTFAMSKKETHPTLPFLRAEYVSVLTNTMEKYYLYIDECGDQNLAAFNPKFPVFTLCGIALDRTQLTALECRMNAVKERFWGTRDVLFHSYEMRSHVGPFKNFCDEQVLLEFYRDIDAILTATDAFVIVSCTILKEPFIRQFGCLGDVYAQSLSVLLERSIFYVDDRSEEGGALEVIADALTHPQRGFPFQEVECQRPAARRHHCLPHRRPFPASGAGEQGLRPYPRQDLHFRR